jgi:hypothetical protein
MSLSAESVDDGMFHCPSCPHRASLTGVLEMFPRKIEYTATSTADAILDAMENLACTHAQLTVVGTRTRATATATVVCDKDRSSLEVHGYHSASALRRLLARTGTRFAVAGQDGDERGWAFEVTVKGVCGHRAAFGLWMVEAKIFAHV